MNGISKRSLIGAVVLAALAAYQPLLVTAAQTEDQLIDELKSLIAQGDTGASHYQNSKYGDSNTMGSQSALSINKNLEDLVKQYPTSTKALPIIKGLLKDSRSHVRAKAAWALGAVHAELDQNDIKDFCELLKAKDPNEVEDVLKALRRLKASETVPCILPLLKSDNMYNVRDACRTLAILANKDVIPSIEPLLNDPEPAVKKDAKDAIFKLRNKQ